MFVEDDTSVKCSGRQSVQRRAELSFVILLSVQHMGRERETVESVVIIIFNLTEL